MNRDIIERYIFNTDHDFTVTQVSENLNIPRGTVYNAIERLAGSKEIFHVGYKESNINPDMLYNRTYRELNRTPVGNPVSTKACATRFIMWLDCDFTVNEISEFLCVSITSVHEAKEKLIEAGLLFKVGEIRGKNSQTFVYNTKDREYFIKDSKELKEQRKNKPKIRPKRPIKQKSRPKYTPKDPLEGLVRPVEAR